MSSSQHPQSSAQSLRQLSEIGLPHSLVATLFHAGFQTVFDLAGLTATQLKQEAGLGSDAVLPSILLGYLAGSPDAPPNLTIAGDYVTPSTQQIRPSQQGHSAPASSMLSSSRPRTYYTPSRALNMLLSRDTPPLRLNGVEVLQNPEGGLRSRYILEIIGPPGSGKGCLALELIRSAVSRGEGVLVLDTQSSLTPDRIKEALRSLEPYNDDEGANALPVQKHPFDLVLHASTPTLAHLMAFLHTLSSYLESNPQVSLIVLSMLSFVFQPTDSLNLPNSSRNHIFEKIKQILTLVCMQHGVTIVVTNQVSTKMVGVDGGRAAFEADTITRAVLQSPLGNSFLAASRAYRIMLFRDTVGVRYAKLISSPAMASAAPSRQSNNKRSANGLHKSGLGVVHKAAFLIDVGFLNSLAGWPGFSDNHCPKSFDRVRDVDP